MNKKMTLKIARQIMTIKFKHAVKSEKVEKVIYENYKDEDCESLIEIFKILETECILNFEKLESIYNSLFPSLERMKFNDEKVFKLLKYVKKIKHISQVFKYIIKNEVFNDLTFEIGILIFNNLLFLSEKRMIVIFFANQKELKKLSKSTQKKFDDYLDTIFEDNKIYEIVKPMLSIKEIKEKCKSIDINCLKLFAIDEIKLYGSYAKKRNNEYSDIDILLMSKETPDIRRTMQNRMNDILTNVFGVQVDTHAIFIGSKLDTFENNVLEYAITILKV